VAAHGSKFDLNKMAFLPIPGIKPMLGLIPLACDCTNDDIVVMTMTNPGYPTPADQCQYLRVRNSPFGIDMANKFLFSIREMEDEWVDLWMLNYPHNPSGQVATKKFWEDVCYHCEKYHIRLFNDAAYSALTHSSSACSLSEVATHFPNLSWAEAFSASKLIGNGTGWRIGAMAGSPDFIADIAEIKGNSDSGFFAPAAAGVLAALETDQIGIGDCRRIYAKRIELLIAILGLEFGLRLAVKPKAGFFTLWKTPKMAFGQEMADAEMFNNLMIERTGIVGVPFGVYIRYAVTSPIDKSEWQEAIRAGFKQVRVKY
jgi:LL-diaminopimelate aminotransferase